LGHPHAFAGVSDQFTYFFRSIFHGSWLDVTVR
jgi:hypothetical protein